MKRETFQPKSDTDAYASRLKPPMKEMVKGLRKIILDASKGINENMKWGNLVYECNGLVCAIVNHKSHVNLEFWHGTALKDPKKMLQGTGKRMRHIKLRTPDDIDSKQISTWIKESIKLTKK